MSRQFYSGRNISSARFTRSSDSLAKPQVLISRCLLGQDCRYDGKIFSFCEVEELKNHFQFIPICPEVKLGLSSPRPPIKLIKGKKSWLLRYSDSHICLHNEVRNIVLKYIKNFNIEAMILKEKSPTCGPHKCKYYHPGRKGQNSHRGKTAGLLPRITKKHYPHLPLINELQLQNARDLYYFLVKLYARFNWRKLRNNYSIAALQKFHASYKLLLLGYNRELVDKLGRILADQQKYSKKELLDKYYTNFMKCLSLELNRANWKNVILHGFGHISDNITPQQKDAFLAKVEEFMQGNHNYLKLNDWLHRKANKLENNYLLQQKFLAPYPQTINKSLKNCGTIPNPF